MNPTQFCCLEIIVAVVPQKSCTGFGDVLFCRDISKEFSEVHKETKSVNGDFIALNCSCPDILKKTQMEIFGTLRKSIKAHQKLK